MDAAGCGVSTRPARPQALMLLHIRWRPLYEDEIRSMEGPDAPASAAGGGALRPDHGKGMGVGIGSERDPRIFGGSCAGVSLQPPIGSSLYADVYEPRSLGEGPGSCGRLWDVYRALRAVDGHSCRKLRSRSGPDASRGGPEGTAPTAAPLRRADLWFGVQAVRNGSSSQSEASLNVRIPWPVDR